MAGDGSQRTGDLLPLAIEDELQLSRRDLAPAAQVGMWIPHNLLPPGRDIRQMNRSHCRFPRWRYSIVGLAAEISAKVRGS